MIYNTMIGVVFIVALCIGCSLHEKVTLRVFFKELATLMLVAAIGLTLNVGHAVYKELHNHPLDCRYFECSNTLTLIQGLFGVP